VIKQYFIIGRIVLVVGVLVLIMTLYLSGKAARAERDLAMASLTTVTEANESLKQSLDAEIKQRQQVEQVLAERIAEQKRIEADAAERLRRKNRELAELRRANEKVDTYLNLPVPGEYLDWVRRQSAGDQDGNDKDVPTGRAGVAVP